MRVRDWQDIMEDVADEGADPDGWRAVGGTRSGGIGEDLYLGHPDAGLYHLKTYARNPYDVKGVGTRVARSLDEEIGSFLPEESPARFGVQPAAEDESEAEAKARRLEETIKAHADAPTTPDDLFADVMEAVDSPAFGPLEYDERDRPDDVEALADTFEEAEELLDAELDDLIEDDGVGRGFD